MALIILFSLHYIMSFTFNIIDKINDTLGLNVLVAEKTEDTTGIVTGTELPQDKLMTDIRELAEGEKNKDYGRVMTYSIMYAVLIVYIIKFTIVYLKRVIYLSFLAIIAPLIAVTYPLDKEKDGQAQAFNMWMKEFFFNSLMQPMHLLLYYVLVTMASNLVDDNWIYAIICIGFISHAEKFIRKLFKMDKAGEASALSSFTEGALVSQAIGMIPKGGKLLGGSNPGGKGPGGDGNGPKDNSGIKMASLDDVFDNGTSGGGSPLPGPTGIGGGPSGETPIPEPTGGTSGGSSPLSGGVGTRRLGRSPLSGLAITGGGRTGDSSSGGNTSRKGSTGRSPLPGPTGIGGGPVGGSTGGAPGSLAGGNAGVSGSGTTGGTPGSSTGGNAGVSASGTTGGNTGGTSVGPYTRTTVSNSRSGSTNGNTRTVKKTITKTKLSRTLQGTTNVLKYTGKKVINRNTIRTVAGITAGVAGAGAGLAAGIASGDLGKAAKYTAIGATAGSGLATAGIDKVTGTVRETKQAARNVSETFMQGYYGDDQTYQDEHVIPKLKKENSRDSKVKEKYKNAGFSDWKEAMDSSARDKLYHAGVVDEDKIISALKVKEKHHMSDSEDDMLVQYAVIAARVSTYKEAQIMEKIVQGKLEEGGKSPADAAKEAKRRMKYVKEIAGL